MNCLIERNRMNTKLTAAQLRKLADKIRNLPENQRERLRGLVSSPTICSTCWRNKAADQRCWLCYESHTG